MNFPSAKSIFLSRAHEKSGTDELEATLALAARSARRHAVASIYRGRAGHAANALASADVLAGLFGAELNVWPSTVNDPDRDRFVLSEGDAAPVLNAIAAHYNFGSPSETFATTASAASVATSPVELPFIKTSADSPGQALSVALGMALGLELQRRPSRVYTLLGAAEVRAGEVWQTAMCATQLKCDNLCAIVTDDSRESRERANGEGHVSALAAKWRAFDWAVIEIDGHDISQILSAFRRTGSVHGRPALIIAHTVTGKGVPAFERDPRSGNARLSKEQAADALCALGCSAREVPELLHDAG